MAARPREVNAEKAPRPAPGRAPPPPRTAHGSAERPAPSVPDARPAQGTSSDGTQSSAGFFASSVWSPSSLATQIGVTLTNGGRLVCFTW